MPVIHILHLMPPCSANDNATYLRNIFLSGLYLNLLEHIFPML